MTHPTATRSSVGARLVIAGMATAAILGLTLAPRSLVAPARGTFMRLLDGFAAPLITRATYGQLESALNSLMFVPLGVALAVLLGRKLWILAPVIGFLVSCTVEYAQAQIPGRVPDAQDIFWNTFGALVGAVVAGLILWCIRPRERLRPRPTSRA